jgi:glycosyltransferase involved in cell wall biosynthesis
MNICYISNSAAPSTNASSLQISKLCEYISKQGHNVCLILPNSGFRKNFYTFYNIKKKYKIKKLKYFTKFPTGLNYYLFSIIAILKSNFLKQDLYITRNFFTSFLLSIFNKKHILEIHDDILIESRIVQILIKYFHILNYKPLIKIVTTTNALKRRYDDYGVELKKVKVLHNASAFESKFKSLNKKKKKYLKIGYFGAIFKSRGIDLIIKLSSLDQKNKYFVYGGMAKQIKNIKNNIKNNNIYFYPYIPYSKVEKKIKQIDICILPYTSKITVSGNVGDISKYTSPLKIFDYMKLGKLIISSNLPVLNEILINNYNSILIKNYKSHKEWFNKIKYIENNIEKFETIRLNAFNYAKKYNLDWRVKKLLSF